MKRIKLKKRKNRLRFKRKLVLTTTLVLLFVFGIGYSFLSVNLNILGTITVKKHYGNTLYEVLEKENYIGSYAKEYAGEHHDSFTIEPTKSIYYWYGSNETNGTTILNMNNVIFADHCWQMIRTTDTGGVKMIYNGEPENNQCSRSRRNHVGYAAETAKSLETTYYYGTSYTYDKTNNVFSLDGTVSTGTIQTGQYTCRSTNATGTCATLYLVDKLNNGTSYYVIPLNGNSNYSQYGELQYNIKFSSPSDVGYMNNISYSFRANSLVTTITMKSGGTTGATYTYGNTYTDNGNGTYTINNPTTFNGTDWSSYYGNIGSGKYMCSNATNNTCSDLWYTVTTNESNLSYIQVANDFKYAQGFTYSNGTYTLNSDSVSFWDISDSTNKTSLNSHHYTCWNLNGQCTNISYIYRISNNVLYFINISNGKSIEDALNEMLYNNDVNSNNSTIKTGIDAWYKRYMTGYTSKLEDIIYCNNRVINSFGGWKSSNGSLSSYLYFTYNNSNNNLNCTNTTDKFSLSNQYAQLTYPVGLLTFPESVLLNNEKIRKTYEWYWLLTPNQYDETDAFGYSITSTGTISGGNLSLSKGIRPVISLKPGTEYISGDGSMTNPYVVTTS